LKGASGKVPCGQDGNSATSENSAQGENSAKSKNSAQSENSAKRENSAQIASGKVPCGLCGKQISKKSMKVHERVHTGEKPFSCTYCQMKFKQKTHVKVIYLGVLTSVFGCSSQSC
jgi:hypothetical protein